MSFERMWGDLLPIGRDPSTGGYFRAPFGSAERELAAWYAEEAARRGLETSYDGQGNAIAWWRPDGVTQGGADSGVGGVRGEEAERGTDSARASGVLIGSHLDSVNNGGAYDGPLGVISSFAAIDLLRQRGDAVSRPIGVAMFVEEEGSRFGVACLGSRLATDRMSAEAAAELRDRDGVWLLDAMVAAGIEPQLGPSALLDDVGCTVELHVEQGRDLVVRDRQVGMASASWAHGRWRFDFTGEPNHAGTTGMADRRDPMLTFAMTALAANKAARLGRARATFGRVETEPNVTNAIPGRVSAWLDARAEGWEDVERLVASIHRQAAKRAGRDRTGLSLTGESSAPTVHFDPGLAKRVARVLDDAPVIPTAAGHDAAVLQAAGVPSAMLFVRNPTGVSHSPAEYADMSDCLAGVEALADVVADLAA